MWVGDGTQATQGGERVVVALEIADTRDARQLWNEKFEGTTSKLRALLLEGLVRAGLPER